MVNKKIKAVKNIKTPKAPRLPRATRTRQPASQKKAPTQNVYIYTGSTTQPNVYSNIQPIPQQFIQPREQNVLYEEIKKSRESNIPQEQIGTLEKKTKTDEEIKQDNLKYFNLPKNTTQEVLDEKMRKYFNLPKKETKKEILTEDLLELQDKPPEKKQSKLSREEYDTLSSIFSQPQTPAKPIGNILLLPKQQEDFFRPQPKQNTEAKPFGNILLLPKKEEKIQEDKIQEEIFRPQPRPRKQPTIIKTQPPQEPKPKKTILRFQEEEDIIETIPPQPQVKQEIIKPKKYEKIQEEKIQEEIQPSQEQVSDYEKYITATKKFQEEEGIGSGGGGRIFSLDEPIQTREVIQQPIKKEVIQEGKQAEELIPVRESSFTGFNIGKPKGGVIIDYKPEPIADLSPDEEQIRLNMYDELTKGKLRDEIANEITAFSRRNDWVKTFRDENGNKIAKTSETLRDEDGKPLKTKSGGNRQRDFNIGELKGVLDKLIIEKIKRERK